LFVVIVKKDGIFNVEEIATEMPGTVSGRMKVRDCYKIRRDRTKEIALFGPNKTY